MNVHDAIGNTMNVSSMVLNSYIGDLSDDELMTRPGEGCNHIAWQLGHLIAAEKGLLEAVSPGSSIELPTGFEEKHNKETIGDNDASNFCSKQEYMELFEKSMAASKEALSKTSEADLDQPSPEHFRQMFPTVGDIYILIATHRMMHAGQCVPVRRALDKPVVI